MPLNVQANVHNAHVQTHTGGICVHMQAYKCSYENKYRHSHNFKLASFAKCLRVCVCVVLKLLNANCSKCSRTDRLLNGHHLGDTLALPPTSALKTGVISVSFASIASDLLLVFTPQEGVLC